MPTYEYACRDCGQHVEVVQSFRDDPLTQCPHCAGRLRKVYGTAGIIFKGSGYYVTDSRKQPAKAGTDDGPDAKSDAKKEPKESAGAAGADAGKSGGDKADKAGAGKPASTSDAAAKKSA